MSELTDKRIINNPIIKSISTVRDIFSEILNAQYQFNVE